MDIKEEAGAEEWAADLAEAMEEVAFINNNKCINKTKEWWWEWELQEGASLRWEEVEEVDKWANNNIEPPTTKDLHQEMFLTRQAGVSKFIKIF